MDSKVAEILEFLLFSVAIVSLNDGMHSISVAQKIIAVYRVFILNFEIMMHNPRI